MNENVLEVVKTAIRYNKVPVTDDTITESLKSHPQYPSLKSICDSLKEWNVEHYPMRLDQEELKEAGTSFIAHLNDEGETLAFVQGINGRSTVEYFDNFGKLKKIGEDEFFNKYSGIAILIVADKKSGEERYLEKRQFELLHKGTSYLVGLAILLLIANAFVYEPMPDLSQV
ncbi:MAG: cysteine peptidase family C39 domain-containing protein [Cytophagales bacterium]|nr:cysteine peptidase family C39 domain-containing protein [Cytophagales bacterium]